MSNPAVITLANRSEPNGKFKRFVVEDNIGEAIHLHIDNMRLDFSIQEYLKFALMIRTALDELEILPGFSINNFDEHFLESCSQLLLKLHKISIEEIKLSELLCIVHSNYHSSRNFIRLSSIDETPAYKYLKGDTTHFVNYGQYNYFNLTNETRLLQMAESIKNNGYPHEHKYLILFNGQDIVRDGQHRAAILAYLYGLDYKAKIMRFHFSGHEHLLHVNRINFYTLLKLCKNISMNLAKRLKIKLSQHIAIFRN